MRSALLASLLVVGGAVAADPYPPLKADNGTFGTHLQRTMRRLATSTAEHRNTVRILFYGQSITEQKWTELVLADLRKRFPHADIVAENRALGGFSSQLLVKTAETDLYPFQPDLLVFHVYGAHDKYRDLLRKARDTTTAEILIQTDHVTKPSDFTEETDPAKLPPKGTHWDAFMNHNWLPAVAKEVGAELCDQRALWKAYLTENKLEPKALLRDDVHLNAHGEFLMAECVNAYLRYDGTVKTAPADEWVNTLAVGTDIKPSGGKLALKFTGTRVDVVCKAGRDDPAAVLIDGKPPSEQPGCWAFTRAVAKPGGKWPVVAGFGWENTPVAEAWTMAVKRDPADAKRFTFTVEGSKTGKDGAGASDKRFVSESKRVVIGPEHWNAEFALLLAGVKPVPDAFTVTWAAVQRGTDTFTPPAVQDATRETTVTLAAGLPNGKHTLTLAGGLNAVAAIRVYTPPTRKDK